MQPKTTAKDFFFYLSSFATLYASAISLISLLFAIVNKMFPDNLNNYYFGYDPYSAGMRMALATLVIIFPVYLFIASYLNRYLIANPDKKELAVRKWLTYLTLFVTGITVIIDLVTLVSTFLGGEISTRFGLKVLAVLIVAGAVFAYYLYDLRKSFTPDMPNRTKLIVSITSIAVLAALVGGFTILGSPAKARNQRFDERRIQDLSMIQSQIVYSYWQNKGELPSSLKDLEDPISGFSIPTDPESAKAYVYEKTDKLAFKLCADFKLPTLTEKTYTGMRPITTSENENWKHEAGTYCFERKVDEQRYPVYPKPITR
jgi:hypothetical protein